MRLGEAFDAGDSLIDARVVLHGAGAQRIHAQIDGVVPCREPGEVADDLDLAQLGQQTGGGAMCRAQQRRGVDGGHIQRRQLVGALARRGFLEDQRLVLGLVGADFAGGAEDGIFSDCHRYSSFRISTYLQRAVDNASGDLLHCGFLFCIRARLQSSRSVVILSILGFSPCGFPARQVGVTIRILVWRVSKSSLDRIRSDIGPVLYITRIVIDSHFGKALLPDLALYPALLAHSVRKAALDQLHRLLNRHSIPNCQKQMHMIGHDYEIM